MSEIREHGFFVSRQPNGDQCGYFRAWLETKCKTELYYYRHRYYDAELGRFLAHDFIGFEESEWNLYEYAASAPTVYVDPAGLACWLSTTLQSVTEEKDANGDVIGCVLKYKYNPKVQTKTIAGKSCPKDCEAVADCSDIPKLDELTVLKLRAPKKKGIPGFRKTYCPPAADWDQEYSFAVNAKNCKSDWLKEFKNCTDVCNSGTPAQYLCKAIKVPLLKQLCEALVKGSISNCIYYCESLSMKRQDD